MKNDIFYHRRPDQQHGVYRREQREQRRCMQSKLAFRLLVFAPQECCASAEDEEACQAEQEVMVEGGTEVVGRMSERASHAYEAAPIRRARL